MRVSAPRANILLRDESLDASIALQLRRVSQRRHLFPLYDIFVTQRAPLAASECPETVPLCFPTAAISSRGVQPQVLRILCFSTAASTLTALVGRGV